MGTWAIEVYEPSQCVCVIAHNSKEARKIIMKTHFYTEAPNEGVEDEFFGIKHRSKFANLKIKWMKGANVKGLSIGEVEDYKGLGIGIKEIDTDEF